jgi:outer membrane lipopolysaccharide assembly protein LptE/RlpB
MNSTGSDNLQEIMKAPVKAPRRACLHLLAGFAGLMAASQLTGCGWRIRGAMAFGFERIMVVAPDQSPQIDRGQMTLGQGPSGRAQALDPQMAQSVLGNGFSERLRRELSARYGLRLVTRPNDAEVVLRIISLQPQRLVVGFSGTGRPREVELKTSLEFRIEDPLGRLLIPTDMLELRRTISVNEIDVLSSDDAERFQINAMEEDLIQQILRRLSGLSRSATPIRPPPA